MNPNQLIRDAQTIVIREQLKINRRERIAAAVVIVVLTTYLVLWAAALTGFAWWMWNLAQ